MPPNAFRVAASKVLDWVERDSMSHKDASKTMWPFLEAVGVCVPTPMQLWCKRVREELQKGKDADKTMTAEMEALAKKAEEGYDYGSGKFDRLDDDVFGAVLTFCDWETRGMLEATCKRCQYLCLRFPHVADSCEPLFRSMAKLPFEWETVVLTSKTRHCSEELTGLSQRIRVRNLSLSCSVDDFCNDCVCYKERILFNSKGTLTKLQLTAGQWLAEQILDDELLLPKLEELKLFGESKKNDFYELIDFVRHFAKSPQLRVIEMNGECDSGTLHALASAKHIRSLRLFGAVTDSLETGALRHLTEFGCRYEDLDRFYQLLDPSIESVVVEIDFESLFGRVEANLSQLRNLTVLFPYEYELEPHHSVFGQLKRGFGATQLEVFRAENVRLDLFKMVCASAPRCQQLEVSLIGVLSDAYSDELDDIEYPWRELELDSALQNLAVAGITKLTLRFEDNTKFIYSSTPTTLRDFFEGLAARSAQLPATDVYLPVSWWLEDTPPLPKEPRFRFFYF